MKEIWFDKQVLAKIDSSLNQSMNSACEYLVDEVRDSMRPGTGNFWPSKKPGGGLHRASVPGVPPAPDTEELKRSISWATSSGGSGGGESGDAKISNPYYGANTGMIVGKVGTTNEKGWFHEMGWTINGDKRPFLRPILNTKDQEIIKILSRNKI